jgi:hypothetical protein
MLRVASAAQLARPTDIFFGEEQHLLLSYRRHSRCARVLLETDSLIDEADFHAHLASECLVKHLFCLLRYSLGMRANLPNQFGTLKTARNFGHDVKLLAKVLIDHDAELSRYAPLLELVTLLSSGEDWNEDRYRERKPSLTRTANVRRLLEVTDQIDCDLGEPHAE